MKKSKRQKCRPLSVAHTYVRNVEGSSTAYQKADVDLESKAERKTRSLHATRADKGFESKNVLYFKQGKFCDVCILG